MERTTTPIEIRDIARDPNDGRALMVTIMYRENETAVRQKVQFNQPHPIDFTAIIGEQFDKTEIDPWVAQHNGQFDRAGFLWDQLVRLDQQPRSR